MPKIIVDLFGGLGNQFFIYSMARGIKKKTALNTNWYKEEKNCFRELGLYNYNVSVPQMTNNDLVWFKFNSKIQKICGHNNVYYKEKEFAVFDEFAISGKASYLSGYWQNIKYFEHIIPELKKELTYKLQLSSKSQKTIETVKSINSVAVHVRRGDYLKLQEYYSIPNTDYYFYAIEMLKKEIQGCMFFVFSDDINWCKETFSNVENIVCIDDKYSESMYEDFEIMRNCKHFIIPNSTFSWWAAFLSDTDIDKRVITTKNWYVDKTMNENCINAIVPNVWRLI